MTRREFERRHTTVESCGVHTTLHLSKLKTLSKCGFFKKFKHLKTRGTEATVLAWGQGKGLWRDKDASGVGTVPYSNTSITNRTDTTG